MRDSDFALLKPVEIRKRYSEFVMFNKSRALLPSKRKAKKTKPKRQGLLMSSSDQTIDEPSLIISQKSVK